MINAKISEIFESFQGEGLFIGVKQLFIRFFGCNLKCKFCDTKLFSYEEYTPKHLIKKIGSIKGNFHSLCLTGGEPLLHTDFLKVFLENIDRKTYLETNATLPEQLDKIINKIDIISMDIKLPTSTGTKGFWREHKEFLKIVLKRKKEIIIKTVICNSTSLEDFKRAVSLIREFDCDIPLIIQPNSYELGEKLIQTLEYFYNYSSTYLRKVRIIPQMHKLLGIK